MSFTGYRLYRGPGGLDAVDFSAPVGEALAGESSLSVAGLDHGGGGRWCYVLRPVREGLECPDLACRLDLQADAAGGLRTAAPAAAASFHARLAPGGRLALRWLAAEGGAGGAGGAGGVASWELRLHTRPRPDAAAPPEALVAAVEGWHAAELTPPAPGTWYVSLRALSADGCGGGWAIRGPLVVRADPPTPPSRVEIALV